MLSKTLSIAQQGHRGDRTEIRTFFHFVKSISVQLGGYYDPKFWQTALPMAHDHEQVYNAIIVVATLYFLPMSDITDHHTLQKAVPPVIRSRYQHAQQWYNRSVNQSMATVAQQSDSISSTRLLLFTTIFYIYAELRQGHYTSLEQLFHTAFAIVHSARSNLIVCKDGGILACLARLCDFAFTTGLNGAAISRSHWQSAILIGLSIRANIGASDLYQIQFELNNIQFDVDYITGNEQVNMNDTDINDHGLALRLQQWEQATTQYEKQPGLSPMIRIHLARLRCLFPLYKARWANLQRASPAVDWRLFEKPIDQLVGYFELMLRLSHNPPYSGPVPLYLLEMVWIPVSICAVWHCRTGSIVARCTAMLDKFRFWGQDRFLDTVIGYLENLRDTGYTQTTKVERELFGSKHRESLLLWQSSVVTQHLLEESGQSSESTIVIDPRVGW